MMNNKLIIKRIGLVLLLLIFFLAGLYTSALYHFAKSLGSPHIESETKARNRITANIHLPENATRLYYAHCGFVDADHYMAFSLGSSEACEQFITKDLGLKLEDFKETTELPEDFAKYGPNTWEKKYKDPAWDLKKVGKYLLYEKSYYRPIIYAPEKNRFYLHY